MKSKALITNLLLCFTLLTFGILSRQQIGYAAQIPNLETTTAQDGPPTPPPTIEPTETPYVRVTGREPRDRPFEEPMPQIQLKFNRPIPAEDITQALVVEPEIQFELTVNENEVTIQISEPLIVNTDYQFKIVAEKMVSAGYKMTADYRWMVKAASPIKKLVGISSTNPLGPIRFDFNYPLDPESFETSLVADSALLGDFTWNETFTQVEIELKEELPPDTLYELRFQSSLSAQNGRDLGTPPSKTFTTPHVIAQTEPNHESTTASPNAGITIRFNQRMDPASTAAAATISPDIPGVWRVEENELIFTPTFRFTSYSRYEVTLEESALDAKQEPVLSEAYLFEFRTTYYVPPVSFGFGEGVQVVDAGGRRMIQYGIFGESIPETVIFDLYRIDPTIFPEVYAKSGRVGGGWWHSERRYIDYAQFEPVTSWPLSKADPLRETVIPQEVPPGFYLVNLVIDGVEDQLLINLTNYRLMTKRVDNQVTTWIVSNQGEAVSNGQAWIFNRQGEPLANGEVERDGLFKTEIGRDDSPALIMGQAGDDFTISTLRGSIQSGNWENGQRSGNPTAELYTITDRPIYKPGDTVNFKVLVRAQDDAVYTVPPAGTDVQVLIFDPRGNRLQKNTLQTDDFGTVNGSFLIEEGVTLGNFKIITSFNGMGRTHSFSVEAYRKPDMTLTLNSDQPYYQPGEEIEVEIDSSYFFGEPVANAELTILRFERSYGGWEEVEWRQTPLEARTDEEGKATVTIPIPSDLSFASRSTCYSCIYRRSGLPIRTIEWGIEATINDGSNQPVSSLLPIPIYQTLEGIKLERSGYMQKPGESFVITGQLLNVSGATPSRRSGELLIKKYIGGGSNYTTVQRLSLEFDGSGTFQADLTIEDEGYYLIEAKSEDPNGHPISARRYFYVIDRTLSRRVTPDSDLNIIRDKESYQPGETARLLIESSMSGPALLTIERGSVKREEMIELTAPLTTFDLPLEAVDAPNVHVSIAAWVSHDNQLSDEDYYTKPEAGIAIDYVNLSLPQIDKALNIEIVSNKESYGSREEATFTLRVTNYRGDPVSADLSFALVDEAIFALKGPSNRPIYSSFYYERNSRVSTHQAFHTTRYIGEVHEEFLGGRGGGGGGDDYAADPPL